MGKRIVALALTGWAGIIALAWWLANGRIEICGSPEYEQACIIRATAARDYVLIVGLTVALIVVVVALIARVRRERLRPLGQASRVHRLPAE